MKDTWQIEAEAANATIDRMGRQNRLMRHAIQKILDGESKSVQDAYDIAWKVRRKLQEIDEELWKEKGPVAWEHPRPSIACGETR